MKYLAFLAAALSVSVAYGQTAAIQSDRSYDGAVRHEFQDGSSVVSSRDYDGTVRHDFSDGSSARTIFNYDGART